jgi:hypothetical protein
VNTRGFRNRLSLESVRQLKAALKAKQEHRDEIRDTWEAHSAEVSNVSKNGFWILIAEKERFVPFADFPWFREARIRELVNVELQSPEHLYWPDLDIDLAVDSIDHHELYPRVSRLRANPTLRPPSRARRKSRPQRNPRAARG